MHIVERPPRKPLVWYFQSKNTLVRLLYNLVNYGDHKTTSTCNTITGDVNDYTFPKSIQSITLQHWVPMIYVLYNITSFGHVDLFATMR
jgi:hypothetical protein